MTITQHNTTQGKTRQDMTKKMQVKTRQDKTRQTIIKSQDKEGNKTTTTHKTRQSHKTIQYSCKKINGQQKERRSQDKGKTITGQDKGNHQPYQDNHKGKQGDTGTKDTDKDTDSLHSAIMSSSWKFRPIVLHRSASAVAAPGISLVIVPSASASKLN
jgi:hypothetical protein